MTSGDRTTLTGTAVLYTILALVGVGVAAIVGVAAVGGNGDSTPLVSSIIGLIIPTVGVLLTLLKVEQVHKVVNSQATALIKANKEILDGRDEKIEAQASTIVDQQQQIWDKDESN